MCLIKKTLLFAANGRSVSHQEEYRNDTYLRRCGVLFHFIIMFNMCVHVHVFVRKNVIHVSLQQHLITKSTITIAMIYVHTA